jgi:hypothetical protein
MGSSLYSSELALGPISRSWIGVGSHPSTCVTHDSDPPHHEPSNSSRYKKSIYGHIHNHKPTWLQHQGQMINSLPPYNPSYMSLVNTQTINLSIRNHCQLLRDRNHRTTQGAECDSAPCSYLFTIMLFPRAIINFTHCCLLMCNLVFGTISEHQDYRLYARKEAKYRSIRIENLILNCIYMIQVLVY